MTAHGLAVKLVVVTAGAVLAACGKSSPTAPAPPGPPITIAITGERTLGVGQTAQLKAIASTGQDVTAGVLWKTSDRLVATVSTTGVVSGIRTGTVEISAADGPASATLSMVVDLVQLTAPAIASCGAIVAPGNYTLGKDVSLTGAVGSCLVIQASGVRLDCGGHTVGGMRVSNANDVVVTNCTFVTVAFGSEQSYAFVINSTNVTFERNKLSCIVLQGGGNNQVVGNTIDGGYDGSGNIVGQDDGVILTNETDDVIEGNTIQNAWDAGIEGTDAVSNTRIVNNVIDNIGSTGISSYWCTAWTGNTVSGNVVTRAPGLVRFIYRVSETKCLNTSTVGLFLNNRFVGNRFALPLSLQQSRGSMNFDLPHIAGRVENNLIQDNDMGTADGPYVDPASGFINGGGNTCAGYSSVFCGAGGLRRPSSSSIIDQDAVDRFHRVVYLSRRGHPGVNQSGAERSPTSR